MKDVSVVIAAIDMRATVRASLERFAGEVAGKGELVLVDASRDGTADLAERSGGVRVLRRPPGSLVPELWRDGLEAVDTPLVAFSTARMRPTPGWLGRMLDRLAATDAAAVGGPIEPGDGLSGLDSAVYLHRYVNYLSPLDPVGVDPPGDNSLYRRDRLDRVRPIWEDGFWEVEVHRGLRANGETLALAPDAAVTYLGGEAISQTLEQRYHHSKIYGSQRAERMGGLERLARTVAAPGVPATLLVRALGALRRRGRPVGPWAASLPWLSLLLTAWAGGEVRGLWCESRPGTLAGPASPGDRITEAVFAHAAHRGNGR